MIRSARQLKDKIRNLAANETGVQKAEKAQALLRVFMMERFLERLSISRYHDKFILKGGMLIAAHTGVESRMTKDIDTTVRMLSIQLQDIRHTLTEIAEIDLDDGIQFEIQSAEQIMESHDYPGVRFGIMAYFETITQHFSIDVSTNDIITPDAVMMDYPMLFETRTIPLLVYNLETLLAEKMETILSRGLTNTRMRDFYDIYMLSALKKQDIHIDDLQAAFDATAEKRGTKNRFSDLHDILEEIQCSDTMRGLWENFKTTYRYVENVSWEVVLQAVKDMADQMTAQTPKESDEELLGTVMV